MTRLCARSLVVDQDLVDMEDMDRGLCTTAEEVGVVPLRQLPPLLLAEEEADTADTDRTCLTTADTVLPITAGDGPCPTEVEEVGVVPLRQLPPLLLAEEEVDTADLGITLRNPLLTTLLPW